MKNVLPVIALMLSVSGIAVSLAREEVRCYIGLESAACKKDTLPLTRPENTVTDTVSPSDKTKAVEPISTNAETRGDTKSVEVQPSPSPEVSPSPPVEVHASPVEGQKAQDKNTPVEPIPEVSPSPDPSHSTPIEVIPPPQ